MLGALLASLTKINPLEFPDATTIEDENEDTHWSSATNRFEDWFLHPDGENAQESDVQNFY